MHLEAIFVVVLGVVVGFIIEADFCIANSAENILSNTQKKKDSMSRGWIEKLKHYFLSNLSCYSSSAS